jgi:Arc/MetJ-type ribon-helix-helix transcriptional regulator
VTTNNEAMPKIRRSVTISKELMDWIQLEIKRKRFKDVSHAIEYALYCLMEESKKERES